MRRLLATTRTRRTRSLGTLRASRPSKRRVAAKTRSRRAVLRDTAARGLIARRVLRARSASGPPAAPPKLVTPATPPASPATRLRATVTSVRGDTRQGRAAARHVQRGRTVRAGPARFAPRDLMSPLPPRQRARHVQRALSRQRRARRCAHRVHGPRPGHTPVLLRAPRIIPP